MRQTLAPARLPSLCSSGVHSTTCTVALALECPENYHVTWEDSEGNSGEGTVYNASENTEGGVTFTVQYLTEVIILSDVELQGVHSIKKETILEALEIKENAPLNLEFATEWEEKIKAIYSRIGFVYCKVNIAFDPILSSNVRVDTKKLIFKIKEGPRIRIGQIYIQGLLRTDRKLVERELLFETGDWYLRDDIERTQRNLSDLGIFSNVNIKLSGQDILTGKSDSLDIVVDIRETLPGTIVFGPGFSLQDGLRFRLDISYFNLQGKGRKVFGKFKITEERTQTAFTNETLLGRLATIGYVEPWVFGIPVDATFLLRHSAEAENFWTISNGAEVSLSHKVRRFLQDTTISLFYDIRSVEEINAEPIDLASPEGNINVGRIGLRVRVDERNNRRWPTSGFYFENQLALAKFSLGGDLGYFNWSFGIRGYYEVVKDLVLAVGYSYEEFVNARREDKNDPQILPLAERIFAGGGETVRGFIERSLGPNVVGSDLLTGGSRRILWKNELRYLIFDPVVFSLFGDFGNVWFSQEEEQRYSVFTGKSLVNNVDYDLVEFLKNPFVSNRFLYFSYGVSVGALTPLGSLNVSYGIPHSEPWAEECRANVGTCKSNVNHDISFISRGRFSFNFGVTF